MTIILDPTAERTVATRPRLARPDSIEGKRIGLLDIGKARGDVFLDQVEKRLTERGLTVTRYAKPTNARPAPTGLAQQIATEVDLVIEALSDWGSCTSCCTHDIADLEGRGIPVVGIATTEFIQAAEAQAKALGTDPAYVFVPHPIQDRSDAELHALADACLDEVLQHLTG